MGEILKAKSRKETTRQPDYETTDRKPSEVGGTTSRAEKKLKAEGREPDYGFDTSPFFLSPLSGAPLPASPPFPHPMRRRESRRRGKGKGEKQRAEVGI